MKHDTGSAELNNELGIIFSFLDDSNALNTALTSQRMMGFFSKEVAPLRLRNKLLTYFAFGQRNKASALLFYCARDAERLSKVLFSKCTFTDCGGRMFLSASLWGYVLWARDRHSWAILLPYIMAANLGEKALQQIDHLDANGFEYILSGHKIREAHYQFDELTVPLRHFCSRYEALWRKGRTSQMKRLWSQVVGAGLAGSVAHIRQEYCRPDRSMYPTPCFDDHLLQDEAFFEGVDGQVCDWLSPDGCPGLGTHFAVMRGISAKATAWEPGVNVGGGIYPALDVEAICYLSQCREIEYRQLAEYLRQNINFSATIPIFHGTV